jgi:AcrR family transcriptional regulator
MKDQKHDKIREKLVESAQRIFEKFGFDKTTMSDIAKEARKGKSSLYYYFSSKEEIFKAVVETEANNLKKEINNSISDITDIKEKIHMYFSVRMNRFQDVANLYSMMRNDYLRKLEFVEKFRQKYDKEELEFIQNLLQEGIDNGNFAINNIEDTSFAIASAVKGLEYPLILSHNHENLNIRIESLINILFYGIIIR